MPHVPNTPDSVAETIKEVKALNAKHNYLGMLSAIRVATNHVEEKYSKRPGYYILKLDYDKRRLRVDFYPRIDQATDEYNQIENSDENESIDAVLVSVSSFSSLKAAYPNYFSDIDDFIIVVNQLLEFERADMLL